LFGSGRQWFW